MNFLCMGGCGRKVNEPSFCSYDCWTGDIDDLDEAEIEAQHDSPESSEDIYEEEE